MKIICAWCNKELGEKDGYGVDGVSHSICNECLAKIRINGEKETRQRDDGRFGNLAEQTFSGFGEEEIA